MPLTRESLERQLSVVEGDLAACVSALKEKSIAGAGLKKNTKWRNLDAKRRQLKTRIFAVKATEDREAACAARLSGAETSDSSESSDDE